MRPRPAALFLARTPSTLVRNDALGVVEVGGIDRRATPFAAAAIGRGSD